MLTWSSQKASEVKWAVVGWSCVKKHAGSLRLLRIPLLLKRWLFCGCIVSSLMFRSQCWARVESMYLVSWGNGLICIDGCLVQRRDVQREHLCRYDTCGWNPACEDGIGCNDPQLQFLNCRYFLFVKAFIRRFLIQGWSRRPFTPACWRGSTWSAAVGMPTLVRWADTIGRGLFPSFHPPTHHPCSLRWNFAAAPGSWGT